MKQFEHLPREEKILAEFVFKNPNSYQSDIAKHFELFNIKGGNRKVRLITNSIRILNPFVDINDEILYLVADNDGYCWTSNQDRLASWYLRIKKLQLSITEVIDIYEQQQTFINFN